jgi:hypothetical protein
VIATRENRVRVKPENNNKTDDEKGIPVFVEIPYAGGASKATPRGLNTKRTPSPNKGKQTTEHFRFLDSKVINPLKMLKIIQIIFYVAFYHVLVLS